LYNIKVDGWKSLLPYKILYLSGIRFIENGLELANIPQENRVGVYDIESFKKDLKLDMLLILEYKGRGCCQAASLPVSGKGFLWVRTSLTYHHCES